MNGVASALTYCRCVCVVFFLICHFKIASFKDKWSPSYDVAAILTSIQALLDQPNPSDPYHAEAAKLYTANPDEFNRRVRVTVEQVKMCKKEFKNFLCLFE